MNRLRSVRSSARAGAERAALDAALDLGFEVGGWVPRGIPSEGPIPARYAVSEASSRDPAVAAEWNVRDADGTLILSTGRLPPEAQAALRTAHRLEKPVLVVDLLKQGSLEGVVFWIRYGGLRSLNVAGPDEAAVPGIRAMAMEFLKDLLVAAQGPR